MALPLDSISKPIECSRRFSNVLESSRWLCAPPSPSSSRFDVPGGVDVRWHYGGAIQTGSLLPSLLIHLYADSIVARPHHLLPYVYSFVEHLSVNIHINIYIHIRNHPRRPHHAIGLPPWTLPPAHPIIPHSRWICGEKSKGEREKGW